MRPGTDAHICKLVTDDPNQGFMNSTDQISVDVLVIGGGINGAAVARDAVGRGLSVMLAERDDYAGATSSASSKMIHGGLRYLEQFAFSLVRESLNERETLLRIAPHLVEPVRFLVPLFTSQSRPAWLIHAGLKLYDLLGRRETLPRSGRLLEEEMQRLPRLRKDGLKAVLHYPDCRVDDARLVLATLLDARARGADIGNRREVTGIQTAENGYQVQISEFGVRRSVLARFVINATGPWVTSLSGRAAFDLPTRNLRLVRGSHIVLPMPDPAFHSAFTLQQPDGRVVFTVPWLQGRYLYVGTTDAPHEGDAREAVCSDAEAAYLLDCYNKHFEHPGGPATKDDVAWTWSGVRALADDGKEEASKVTREAELLVQQNGSGALVTIYGGKLTTHRSLAEDVIKELAKCGAQAGGSWTASAPLHGGTWSRSRLLDWVDTATDIHDVQLRNRWAFTYGSEIETLLATHAANAASSREIVPGVPEAELHNAVRNEDARNGEDFLYRRTKLFIGLDVAEKDKIEEWFAKYA